MRFLVEMLTSNDPAFIKEWIEERLQFDHGYVKATHVPDNRIYPETDNIKIIREVPGFVYFACPICGQGQFAGNLHDHKLTEKCPTCQATYHHVDTHLIVEINETKAAAYRAAHPDKISE